jgi:hypothetical protein
MDKDDFSNVIDKTSLAAALIVPGGIPLYAAARYLKNLYNYKCVIECSKSKEKTKCYHECNIKSIKNILKDLEFEYKIKRCDLSDHPKRCRKKLLTQIEYWQKRLIDAEYSYEKYLLKR